jgi:hypothetical protein
MQTASTQIDNFPKRCTCCKRLHTAGQWRALERVGDMVDEVEALELRNCRCGSTIAIVLWSRDPATHAMYADTIPVPALGASEVML